MTSEQFKGKRVVIMGLGLHGGGRACAQWFFSRGAQVIVTDLKNREELESSMRALDAWCRSYRLGHAGGSLTSIEYHLSRHREDDFKTADLIVQNPGVPRESPYLAIARSSGIPIENEATLFFKLTPGTLKVGVTGTRGKSTTVTVLGDIIRAWNPLASVAGVATHDGARALCDILEPVLERERAGTPAPVVVELSSWHLELFSPDKGPDIAVVTSLYPDHLNRYGSVREYYEAKENIIRSQRRGARLVVNADNAETVRIGASHESDRDVFWFSTLGPVRQGAYVGSKDDKEWIFLSRPDGSREALCPTQELSLPGRHNLSNMLCAAATACAWGVPSEHIIRALTHFRGVPGRLERVATDGDREWIDDTTSTTPEAICAALATLERGDPSIVLIVGGADKRLDYSSIAEPICKNVHTLIALSGTATVRMLDEIGKAGFRGAIILSNSMDDAVVRAWQASAIHDRIVLSPGAASFGQFANEFDRGRAFREAVHRLFSSNA